MSFAIDPDLLGLEDNVALVTGGGGVGMGRAHCVQLARAGCHIVVADIDAEGGAETVREVERVGRKAAFVQANVRRPEKVRELIHSAGEAFGRLDVAINHVGNAGETGVFVTPFLDFSPEAWNDVVTQNLTSTMLCCQAEALHMIEHDVPGRIVNVSSSSGVVGAPTIAAYGAAKAGVIHLTKTLGMEFAAYGIRVNCIVPGTHTNKRMKAMMADPDTPPESKRFHELAGKAPPLGRLGEPWETAGLAVFFASRLSAYVTGHSLLSDGGVTHTTARPPVGIGMKPKALEKIGKA
ncbi:MAG: SDR family oxidoreductase [Proteobacteria bacterium]|nr:SDR family oxidoreductase [Pseudomonadota bacterium]